jgi:4-aminobutyrate aminotransferase
MLLVLDEIQTGIGRTGRMFAAEHWEVAADITCLAKGIANGLPLGAIIARADVMDWSPGSHASTFGGNPVACAAALATLKLVKAKYCRNAEVRGVELRNGLSSLADCWGCVRDVRGLGLMVGMEIGNDDGPDPARRDRIIQEAFERGLLLLPCGPSTVRFCPPLCVSSRQVKICLDILKEAVPASASQKETCS